MLSDDEKEEDMTSSAMPVWMASARRIYSATSTFEDIFSGPFEFDVVTSSICSDLDGEEDVDPREALIWSTHL